MQITVPLNKLLLSPRNVRKTPAPDLDIESMAASIRSKGLLQNLVVSESPTGKGFYEVDAGGCRLRALQLLVERKELPRNWPVPCLVVPRDDATEASLAENLRIPMNPADEFRAFATIIDCYESGGIVDRSERIANCARRFGVTERHVEQRLRLADLAPEILDALRENRISLDAAKAYASYPDHKLQMKVFAAEEKKGSWGHSAKAIRDAMRGKVYSIDHPAVIYVGLDAYRAAGGRIERELFMGTEDKDVILDPSIVDKLCAKRTAEDAQHFAQEQGFLDGVVKPWSGPSWAEPKAPAGFKRAYGLNPDSVPEEKRADTVMAFAIASDGSTLEPLGYCYVRAEPESQPARSGYTPETPEQRAARERREAIEERAIRLAAPKVAGTPLEGRAFWPSNHGSWIDPVEQDDDGNFVIALLIKIPAADVEAAMAEAERLYEQEQAELAEEEAALVAEENAEEVEAATAEQLETEEATS
ncbi:ParB/RepB/Spo0J family partition protein [Sphingosinicella sp. CPCC 101087]|uniref:ParB/RepB/Spo0J family partition protein n=1 Tax=Sphingosinicella sp. CPCC 101087 TaxID=2497754 RepID=UPI00101C4F08|nr:ParB/RepB/Spo0J family partition protein [Sphingosinicella sp. CPCC 101087]